MNKIIILTGSPGSGKSTLIKGISNKKIKIANIGTLMQKKAETEKYIKKGDRDSIRYLPNKKINELRNFAFSEVSKLKGNIIIDTHASIAVNGKYLSGLPFESIKKLKNIIGFIYIDTNTTEILLRRIKDKTRIRENEDDYLINTQRIINLSILSHSATYLNISLYIINNKQEMLNKTINEFNERINILLNSN